jgi:hypothetical protein
MMHDHMPMPSVDTWVGAATGRLAVRVGGGGVVVDVVVVTGCGSGGARGGATIDTGMMAALASDMFGRRIMNPRSAATMTATAAASICGTVALFSQLGSQLGSCWVAAGPISATFRAAFTTACCPCDRAVSIDGGNTHAAEFVNAVGTDCRAEVRGAVMMESIVLTIGDTLTVMKWRRAILSYFH